MKVLTATAFLVLPATLISQLFSMNTTTVPLVGMSNDFWVILGIMGIIAIATFAFFKSKKWL